MEDVFGTSDQPQVQNVEPDSPTDIDALGYEEGEEPEATDRPEGPESGHPSQDQPTQEPSGDDERLLAGKYKTTEELEQGFKNLQSLYGRQAEELGRLRQEAQLLDSLRQMGYQIPMSGYRQAPTPMMPAAPQGIPPQQVVPGAGHTSQGTPVYTPTQTSTPQYTALSQQQPQPQPPKQETPEPKNEDPSEWLDKLYQEGPQLIRKMVQEEAQRIVNEQGQVLGQGLSQLLTPVFQTTAQLQRDRTIGQWKTTFDSQIAELKKAEDFEDLVPEMQNIIKRNPQILYSLDPQGNPNGMHVAYLLAKSMSQQAGNVQAAKKAVRMPSSSGSIVKKQGDNEALVDAALGSLEDSGGIFG